MQSKGIVCVVVPLYSLKREETIMKVERKNLKLTVVRFDGSSVTITHPLMPSDTLEKIMCVVDRIPCVGYSLSIETRMVRVNRIPKSIIQIVEDSNNEKD